MAKIGICGYCNGEVHEIALVDKYVKVCLECDSTVDEDAMIQAIKNPTFKMNVNLNAQCDVCNGCNEYIKRCEYCWRIVCDKCSPKPRGSFEEESHWCSKEHQEKCS